MCFEIKGVRKNNIMSQHTFRKEISLVWVDPKKYWKINNKKISINEENYNNTDIIITRSNT